MTTSNKATSTTSKTTTAKKTMTKKSTTSNKATSTTSKTTTAKKTMTKKSTTAKSPSITQVRSTYTTTAIDAGIQTLTAKKESLSQYKDSNNNSDRNKYLNVVNRLSTASRVKASEAAKKLIADSITDKSIVTQLEASTADNYKSLQRLFNLAEALSGNKRVAAPTARILAGMKRSNMSKTSSDLVNSCGVNSSQALNCLRALGFFGIVKCDSQTGQYIASGSTKHSFKLDTANKHYKALTAA